MRDHRDLSMVGIVFVAALLLSVILFWLTTPLVRDNRELHYRGALEQLSRGAQLGEPRSVAGSEVERLIPLQGEAGTYLAEVSVMGYRDRVRFLLRLDGNGTVEGVALLSDSEDPAYDWFLRDPALLTEAFNAPDPAEAVAGATVTVRSMADGVNAARRLLEEP